MFIFRICNSHIAFLIELSDHVIHCVLFNLIDWVGGILCPIEDVTREEKKKILPCSLLNGIEIKHVGVAILFNYW
jgi:hypothetical protein